MMSKRSLKFAVTTFSGDDVLDIVSKGVFLILEESAAVERVSVEVRLARDLIEAIDEDMKKLLVTTGV